MSRMNARGRGREVDVMEAFIARGFWYVRAHRSGQAIKDEYAAARIPGDLFVWHPQIGGFQIEVGGAGKRLVHEFAELRSRLLVGFRPMVVLYVGGAVKSADIRYYLSERDRYDSLDSVLASIREAA